MRLGDASLVALQNLGEHKLRSALTMLGMMFGVGAVIAMLSIGAGAERQALEMIDRMGVRNVLLRSVDQKDDQLKEIRQKSMGLSRRDMRAIEEAVEGVEIVAPRLEVKTYKVLSHSGKSEAAVQGVSEHQNELINLELEEGRFIDSLDERDHAQVAVLGASVRRDLFGAEPAIGRPVKVNDVWFEVVGVLAAESGGASFEGVSMASSENQIYIPFTTALRKFDRDPLQSPLDEVIVEVPEGQAPAQVAETLEALLERLHSGVRDYEIVVPEALLKQSQETQRLFNVVMGCIAGIALLVGGIGIMNIMLASVLEQTREIGIRRAVGARRRDIRFQFLITAFAISSLGGLCGIALGLAIAKVVAIYADWPTVVT
ncbi:MAG: ABC transporter permease, partial [Deltaproteobacteria bacterium]|nr:ABC transporter permease [Deltaproteobacteria bacterium]